MGFLCACVSVFNISWWKGKGFGTESHRGQTNAFSVLSVFSVVNHPLAAAQRPSARASALSAASVA